MRRVHPRVDSKLPPVAAHSRQRPRNCFTLCEAASSSQRGKLSGVRTILEVRALHAVRSCRQSYLRSRSHLNDTAFVLMPALVIASQNGTGLAEDGAAPLVALNGKAAAKVWELSRTCGCGLPDVFKSELQRT